MTGLDARRVPEADRRRRLGSGLQHVRLWLRGRAERGSLPTRLLIGIGRALGLNRTLRRYRRNVPNQRRIEIELTTLCNLRCYNCDMSVRQAQSDGRMTLDQVRRFVDESLALSWDWSRIRLLGGEPTLHPEFLGVVEELARYHRHKPDCVIELVTNGYGTRVQAVLKAVPDWMRIDNSRKTSDRQEFLSFNEAPLDDPAFEAEDFSKGCFVTSDCGMGLSRHGYYPCVVAAGIDRVVGHGLGIRSLAEVKESDMRAELATFCRTCGYFKSRRNRAATVDHEVMSPYWREAYERFRSSPPDLAPL